MTLTTIALAGLAAWQVTNRPLAAFWVVVTVWLIPLGAATATVAGLGNPVQRQVRTEPERWEVLR